MVPIPKAVRVRTSSGWQDIALVGPAGLAGGPLDVRRIQATYGNYQTIGSPVASPAQLYADAGGTVPIRLTYTPPVDCWWDTNLHVGLMQKLNASYDYGIVRATLSPADVDGYSGGAAYIMQHASVQLYEAYHISKIFKLAAGVPYTLNGTFQCSAGTWQYHAGQETLYLEAKALARGAALGPANGMPAGGLAGQLLSKLSGNDYDAGWLGGAAMLFDTGNIGASQALLADWQNIPQTYKHLVMIVSADCASGSGLEFRFNGDASGNYQGNELDLIGTVVSASNQGVLTFARYSVAWGSNIYSTSISIIPNYTRPAVHSVLSMMSGYDTTAFNLRMHNGYWGVANAINRIQLGCFSSGVTYKAGSRATLYGLG